ncbi:MAG: hypothetical protein II008_20655 [Oscillospiraceae bacterium]|nr:hypothetical protein [Oscillospiraceae bacterium]
MTYFDLKDLHTALHIALSEAVMSRIRITETEVQAFQTVHNIISKIESEDGPLFEGEEEK